MATSSGDGATIRTTATRSLARRFAGLVLLLGGIALAFGGLALPWLSYTCTANCLPGALNGPYVPAGNNLFPTCSLLFWLLVAIAAALTAWQEVQPADRRDAGPAYLLAGLLLAAAGFSLLVLLESSPHGPGPFPYDPAVYTALGPGGLVSLLGSLFAGVGGWLRYHAELAEVPSGR
jgi:hypothetical protein